MDYHGSEEREANMTDLLALVGSARVGGNTDLLVSEALKGARWVGATARRVRLFDLDMKPCLGCLACGDGRCHSHDDDIPELLRAMHESHALLFATPVYFWNVSGLMKTLWDRMLPLAGLDLTARPATMNPLLKGHKAGSIVIQEEAEGPHSSICRLFFERNFADFGMENAGEVYGFGALNRGDVRTDEGAMGAAFELGKRLVG